MSNQGWVETSGGGSGVASNARTTGKLSGTDDAMSYVKGSRLAHPSGGDNDELAARSDYFEPPGQLSTC